MQPSIEIFEEQFLQQRLRHGSPQLAMDKLGDHVQRQLELISSRQLTTLKTVEETSHESIKELCKLMKQQLAVILNSKRTRYNRHCLENPVLFDCGFMPLHKVMEGIGEPLGNVEHQGEEEIDQVPELEVGALVPTEMFPANVRALKRMTLLQINQLSRMMNETFGIKEGDDVEQSRDKLLFFLTI